MEYGIDEQAAAAMKRQMIEQGLALMGEDELFRSLLFETLATEDPDLLIRLSPSVYLENFLRTQVSQSSLRVLSYSISSFPCTSYLLMHSLINTLTYPGGSIFFWHV